MKLDIRKYVEDKKTYVGFGNYDIEIKEYKKIDPKKRCQVSVRPFQKVVVLELYGDFFTQTDEQKKIDLTHELIHARVRLKEFKVDRYTEEIRHDEEEHMVNDITKLIMSKDIQ